MHKGLSMLRWNMRKYTVPYPPWAYLLPSCRPSYPHKDLKGYSLNVSRSWSEQCSWYQTSAPYNLTLCQSYRSSDVITQSLKCLWGSLFALCKCKLLAGRLKKNHLHHYSRLDRENLAFPSYWCRGMCFGNCFGDGGDDGVDDEEEDEIGKRKRRATTFDDEYYNIIFLFFLSFQLVHLSSYSISHKANLF